MSSDDESSSDASSSPPPETLVAGRARRTTAGNRLSHLLQHLEDEDIKADLLAEEEDDQKDYSASEGEGGDVALDSSDDSDDDENKQGADDELAGEKELRKQERVESNKKRKARELVRVQPLQKKVKIAEDILGQDGRPTSIKKVDRPIHIDHGPLRQSSRSQTMASAKLTEAKMKESKRRAIKTQEIMRLAAEKKAAEAGPKLTQSDRMARALKIEKENSRSLNRWEKSEQERLRIQQEKLEAMRNRKLDGPVIRYWSGAVTWVWREGPDGPVYQRCKYDSVKRRVDDMDEDVDHSGIQHIVSPPKPRRSDDVQLQTEKTMTTLDGNASQEGAVAAIPDAPTLEIATIEAQHEPESAMDVNPTTDQGITGPDTLLALPNESGATATTMQAEIVPPKSTESFLDGIDEYVEMDLTGLNTFGASDAADHSDNKTAEIQQTSDSNDIFPLPSMPPYQHIPDLPDNAAHSVHSTLPLLRERAARTLVVLDQFPDLDSPPPPTRKSAATTADPAVIAVLLPDAMPSLSAEERRYLSSKHRRTTQSSVNINTLPIPPAKPVCAISGKVAHFRDPKTRLAYADLAASKAIQRVMANGCQWSALLGVWAGIVGEGSLGRVARGVPDGFWTGKVKESETTSGS